MKRLALWLIGISIVAGIVTSLFDGDGPSTAGEYADRYGGQASIYAGILRDTRCGRLWELHELEGIEPGYRIAAADRYNDIC